VHNLLSSRKDTSIRGIPKKRGERMKIDVDVDKLVLGSISLAMLIFYLVDTAPLLKLAILNADTSHEAMQYLMNLLIRIILWSCFFGCLGTYYVKNALKEGSSNLNKK
jgi:hypothetical protein